MLSAMRSVVHPTDFSKESQRAFAHALLLAVLARSRLTLLHVLESESERAGWRGFPGVRKTLERWGWLEEGSPRSAVFEELSVNVEKVQLRDPDPRAAILHFLEREPADLLVLASQGRVGLPRWLHRSLAEPLARGADTSALFVPAGARPFVALESGELSLRRVLIPVDSSLASDPALDVAADAGGLVGGAEPLQIHLLHVGEERTRPRQTFPVDPGCAWHERLRKGPLVEEIVADAAELPADLIVMSTRGHDGLRDVMWGSTTEQVVRRAPCPVLAVSGS